uniref:Uncharacterized protein n=1 Tax=Panagrolaimus davidi TaxID=227884 RepID=A0A914PCE6_9BILA
MKKCPKSNDKENDKLEYYDKIVEEDENELSDVFKVEEKRLPKAVVDSEIDYKKKYEQLYHECQKRGERIDDVKKFIMEGKSRKDVHQRLNGILTHQKPVSSVKNVALEEHTVNVSQTEVSFSVMWFTVIFLFIFLLAFSY